MSTTTQIEWTDATWNPVTGCSKITRGCDLCYAERFSERFRGVPGHPFESGFDITLRPERLTQPLRWRQSRNIFVNSMSDLFHKEVPKPFIDSVFDTMEAADWHSFQVLTILGGPNWEERLDQNLPRGRAVEKLFRDTLREVGDFDFVVSTKIDRATADRPHFVIAYGTKSRDGLKVFRDTEYSALRAHARDRADAKERKREGKSGSPDLFAGMDADVQESSIDEIVEDQKALALAELMETLTHGPLKFSTVVVRLLQGYMLRETNVKDICVDLAKTGRIENTWGDGNRKPRDENMIKLRTSTR